MSRLLCLAGVHFLFQPFPLSGKVIVEDIGTYDVGNVHEGEDLVGGAGAGSDFKSVDPAGTECPAGYAEFPAGPGELRHGVGGMTGNDDDVRVESC